MMMMATSATSRKTQVDAAEPMPSSWKLISRSRA